MTLSDAFGFGVYCTTSGYFFAVAWIASSSACRRTVSSAQSARIQLPCAYSHARLRAMSWSVTRMMGGVNATAFMHEAEQMLAMMVGMGAPRT